MTGGGGGGGRGPTGQDTDRGRWTDLPGEGRGLEAEAGALLRQASDPGAPGPEVLARVQRRLFSTSRPARWRPPGRALRWAVVGLVLLGSGGVVFARRQIGSGITRMWETLRDSVSAPRTRATTRAPMPDRPPAVAGLEPAAPSVAAVPRSLPALAPAAPHPRRSIALPSPRARAPARSTQRGSLAAPSSRVPRPARSVSSGSLPPPEPVAPDPVAPEPVAPGGAVASVPPPGAPGPLAAEAQLLGEAIALLRQNGDARASLAALDRYRRRHPGGSLRIDATIVQLEALIALGRHPGALSVLRRLPPDAVASSPELRLLRAELHAKTSCSAALPDLDWLLQRPLPPELAERALYGRAGCRLRLGDLTGAHHDLRAYRSRFPTGRFLPDVARHLDQGSGGRQ